MEADPTVSNSLSRKPTQDLSVSILQMKQDTLQTHGKPFECSSKNLYPILTEYSQKGSPFHTKRLSCTTEAKGILKIPLASNSENVLAITLALHVLELLSIKSNST
ncbi:hypothetical protein J1N35_011678 [Gossypium stocksii]|uniref:Uncharacterized protein n=1 Tax=Gossypium stocksii TaxID=47602 RepID=A0A9D4ADK8_9ROSI|nr:hypothetical protein J1N35_011678 [Gossypium stocksii]